MSRVTLTNVQEIEDEFHFKFDGPDYKDTTWQGCLLVLSRGDYYRRTNDLHRLRDIIIEDATAIAQGNYDTWMQNVDKYFTPDVYEAAAPSIFRETKATGIEATLEQRGKVHGDYENQCAITNAIKSVIREANNWSELRPSQQEALDMFATKMGRILEGDPNHPDHWHDIAGYATLVENTLVPKDPNQIEMSV